MPRPLCPPHDPGGKIAIPLPPGVHGRAYYGGVNDCYRYFAEYIIYEAERYGTLMVCMMNPSTASEKQFDPTVAKMWRLARRWGYHRLLVTNVHAYRATDQKRLLEVADPVGPENDAIILDAATESDLILMAYGTPYHLPLRARGPEVAAMLRRAGHRLHVLKLSKFGVPCHLLYLSESLVPAAWEG